MSLYDKSYDCPSCINGKSRGELPSLCEAICLPLNPGECDFFNTRLFDHQLPPCLITFQRKSRTYGYFSQERWNNHTGAVTDEIALNPVHFTHRSVELVLSTLAHELVHLWQHHFGKPSRRAYHNRQWADKMEEVGLVPSHTGQPGGARTGEHMSHYIQEGGPFQHACQALIAQGFTISWHDRISEQARNRQISLGRIKYTCPTCGLNAWAKPNVVLLCGECDAVLTTDHEGPPGPVSSDPMSSFVESVAVWASPDRVTPNDETARS